MWGLRGRLLGGTEKRHHLVSGHDGPPEDLCTRVAPCGPGVAGAGGHTVLAEQGGHRQRACQRCTAGLSPRGQL